MLSIIVLLFPGIIAASYYLKLKKEKEGGLSFAIEASIFAFIINMLNSIILKLTGNEYANLTTDAGSHLNYPGFVAKYMVLAFVLSLLLPHIKLVISQIDFSKFNKRDKDSGAQAGENKNDKNKGN